MDSTKAWYQSKTIIANLVALLVWVLTIAASAIESGTFPVSFGALSPVVLIVLNLVLRFLTTSPVAITPPSDGTKAALLLMACLFLVGCKPQDSGPPTAVIRGPTTAIVGEIIELSADQSVAASHFSWEIEPRCHDREQLRPCDPASKSVRVASLPGEWRIRLIASNSAGHAAAEHRITCSMSPGPTPQPSPPDPPPNPGPGPPPPGPGPPAPQPTPLPLPDGQFGMIASTRQIVSKVNSQNKAGEVAELSRQCEQIATDIDSGRLKRLQQIVDRIGQALSPLPPEWDDARNAITDKTEQLYKAGKLSQPAQWAVMLREIKQGLDAA